MISDKKKIRKNLLQMTNIICEEICKKLIKPNEKYKIITKTKKPDHCFRMDR